jgi:hypothetical protein
VNPTEHAAHKAAEATEKLARATERLADSALMQAYAHVFSTAYAVHVERMDSGPISRAADAVDQFKKRCA